MRSVTLRYILKSGPQVQLNILPSKFSEKIALLKNELRPTEQNIKKHEKELNRRFKEQSMAPTERKAPKDVISAIKVVKDRVLKDS